MYHAFSLAICLRYANNRQDALGILNEGFFKAFHHLSTFDFQRSFVSWIGKIMTNAAIDFYRSSLRFNNTQDIADYAHVIADHDPIDAHLHYQDLLEMIQQLPPAYRTVFNLYAIDGYTHEEIGKMLGIAVGTSKSNLFKARARLMEMITTSTNGVVQRVIKNDT